jgi:hypothetical protein
MDIDLIKTIRDLLTELESPDVQLAASAPDKVVAVLGHVDRLKQLARELNKMAEDAAILVINAHGDITVGDIRYYVGTEKQTECTNVVAALDALLAHSGGDLATFATFLASGAIKPGAAKAALGEDSPLFKTTIVSDLKTGKPKKGLVKLNTTFTKPRSKK